MLSTLLTMRGYASKTVKSSRVLRKERVMTPHCVPQHTAKPNPGPPKPSSPTHQEQCACWGPCWTPLSTGMWLSPSRVDWDAHRSGRSQQAGLLSCSHHLHCHPGCRNGPWAWEWTLAGPATCPSERRTGREKRATLVGKQEQCVNTKSKQGPGQRVDCHTRGMEWALSATPKYHDHRHANGRQICSSQACSEWAQEKDHFSGSLLGSCWGLGN